MGNLNLNEKQKTIVTSLNSMNDEQVISIIQEFREKGDIFVVEPLIEMLFSKRGESVKKAILEFVSDIKNQNAVDTITLCIQNHIGDSNTIGLLASCWQSDLDFSKYLPLFIDILCSSDYQASFEAFTVIENSIGDIDKKSIDLYISAIESKLKSTPIEKQSLLTETIVMLESFKRSGTGN
jgi:hypothetical protein